MKAYKVREIANYMAVTLPYYIAEQVKLKKGDRITYTIKGRKIIIEKENKNVSV